MVIYVTAPDITLIYMYKLGPLLGFMQKFHKHKVGLPLNFLQAISTQTYAMICDIDYTYFDYLKTIN